MSGSEATRKTVKERRARERDDGKKKGDEQMRRGESGGEGGAWRGERARREKDQAACIDA